MNAIICLGDSITFGCGEKPAKGWCGRLKNWFESLDEYNIVYNLGIPGDTSTGLLKRIQIELNSRVRYLRDGDSFSVIIAIGTNDLSFNGIDSMTPIDIFKENMSKIFTVAATKVDTVYVLQIPPTHSTIASDWEDKAYLNSDVDKYNAVLADIAKDCFIPVQFLNWDAKVPDGIHPNSSGYQDMFEQIKKLF